MKYLKSVEAVASIESGGMIQKKEVNWNDYNYPPCPCIQMFHYNPEETPERYKRITLLLKLNHIAIPLALLINFVTNIIGLAQGQQMGGLRIGISAFVFLIWLPASLYSFTLPYQIMLGGGGSPIIFYLISSVAFVWFLIWSIADFADANGFVMVSKYFAADHKTAGGFAVIAAIMMMLISFLAFINAILFWKRN